MMPTEQKLATMTMASVPELATMMMPRARKQEGKQ